jgi:hypothetical protein
MENLLDNIAIVIVICVVLFIATAVYEVGKRIAAKIFGWTKDRR